MNRGLSPELVSLLRSPVTRAALLVHETELRSPEGEEAFPIVDGVPILIDEKRSAFSTDAFLRPADRTDRLRSRARRIIGALIPRISHNLAATRNYQRLVDELETERAGPHRVLVVGGSVGGDGFEVLVKSPSVVLVETDVAFGPRTQVICDGHALPFADGTFDAVICQAVLEHVADPPSVVDEIHRVLRPTGLVYSEIPFMQQVHEGAHDFTRFTLIGHRRLFRRFDCVSSGVTAGPATSLAWSIKYLMLTLAGSSAPARAIVAALANYLLFWLKYFDYILVRSPTVSDAASCTYLLCRRSDHAISDRELLESAGADGRGFRMFRQ